MANLNLLFHKIYYDRIGTNDFEEAVKKSNDAIFGTTFVNSTDFRRCELEDALTFRMKTKYPGMLIGIGYAHGSGRADDDIKCGFSFDYVSGQPYIPGSSVKGVLRSYFREHPEAIAEIAKIAKERVKDLETHIFDCSDIFLDAVLYDGDARNRILGKDYITPHSEDGVKNPIPIHIMKVLPDVRFEFRFIVSDFKQEDFTFTKAQKLELFKTLLTLFGIGAKTNVGYGALESDDSAPHARVAPTNTEHQSGGNNTRGNNGYGNNGRGNNSYGNNGHGNNATGNNRSTQPPPRVQCPACNYSNFKYSLSGTKNVKCKRCGAKLP